MDRYPYIVVYEHTRGFDAWLVYSDANRAPTPDEIAATLDDFEPDRDEFVHVLAINDDGMFDQIIEAHGSLATGARALAALRSVRLNPVAAAAAVVLENALQASTKALTLEGVADPAPAPTLNAAQILAAARYENGELAHHILDDDSHLLAKTRDELHQHLASCGDTLFQFVISEIGDVTSGDGAQDFAEAARAMERAAEQLQKLASQLADRAQELDATPTGRPAAKLSLDGYVKTISPEQWSSLRVRLERAAERAVQAANGSVGRYLTVQEAARKLSVRQDAIELLVEDNAHPDRPSLSILPWGEGREKEARIEWTAAAQPDTRRRPTP